MRHKKHKGRNNNVLADNMIVYAENTQDPTKQLPE